MTKRIRNERKGRGRRAVVATLALSSTVCLGLWKGGAPHSSHHPPFIERAVGTTASRTLTSLELAGLDTMSATPWLSIAPEKTFVPPLRITNGGALVDWSAGASLDTSSGRTTCLVAPLLSLEASSDSPGIGSGILTGTSNANGETVGPMP